MDYEHIAKTEAKRAATFERRFKIVSAAAIAMLIALAISHIFAHNSKKEIESQLRIYQEISRQQDAEVKKASEQIKAITDSMTTISYQRDSYKAKYESVYARLSESDEIIESQKTRIYGLKVALREEKQNVDDVARRYTAKLFALRNEVKRLKGSSHAQENAKARLAVAKGIVDSMRVSKWGNYIKIDNAPANARFLMSIYPFDGGSGHPIDKRVEANAAGVVAIDFRKLNASPPFVVEMQQGNRVFYHKAITATTPDGVLPCFRPGAKSYQPIESTNTTRGQKEEG
jgi:hypothetical protein